MKFIKTYQYLYYKIYNFLKLTELDGFWMEWRAYCLMISINIFALFSILNYFTVITKVYIKFPDNKIWICIFSLVLSLVNYRLLLSKNRWKEIIKEFDKLPRKTNDKGTLVSWIIIIFIIVNLIFSFFLMSF